MARRYPVSFKPLTSEAKAFLSLHTGFDFMAVDFRSDDLWFCCTVSEGREPIIVIVFEFKQAHDAHGTVAVANPKGLTRQLLTALYQTVFQRAARVTTLIDPHNGKALKQVWRMGFKPEGYLRRGYDGIRDAAVWGLLPEDCPYLRGGPFRFRYVQQTHDMAERMQ